MNGDLHHHCRLLINRFVHTQYDGISGMSIKAGLFATDAGSRFLRESVDAARQEDMRKRRTLREADFEIVNLDVPPLPEAGMQVTAVEAFTLHYESAFPEDRVCQGRRGLTFTLVMDANGAWVIDEFHAQPIESRSGPATTTTRTATKPPRTRGGGGATTVLMDTAPFEQASPARAARERQREQSLKLLRWWNRWRTYLLVLVMVLLGFVAYLWYYGEQHFLVRVCLYTGLEHESLIVMGRTLYDRDRPSPVAVWATGWIDAPGPEPGGHYWVVKEGYDKALGEKRVDRTMPREAREALETLALIYQYRRGHDRAAIDKLEEYQALVTQLIPILEQQPDAPAWEELRQEFSKMRHRLRGP